MQVFKGGAGTGKFLNGVLPYLEELKGKGTVLLVDSERSMESIYGKIKDLNQDIEVLKVGTEEDLGNVFNEVQERVLGSDYSAVIFDVNAKEGQLRDFKEFERLEGVPVAVTVQAQSSDTNQELVVYTA